MCPRASIPHLVRLRYWQFVLQYCTRRASFPPHKLPSPLPPRQQFFPQPPPLLQSPKDREARTSLPYFYLHPLSYLFLEGAWSVARTGARGHMGRKLRPAWKGFRRKHGRGSPSKSSTTPKYSYWWSDWG